MAKKIEIDDLLFFQDDIAAICRIKNPAFIKLDTTGLTEADSIIRITIVDGNGAKLIDTLINPMKPLPEVTPKLTGITDTMIANYEPFSQFADVIREIVSTHTLVCWNAGFLRTLMEAEFMRVGYTIKPECFDLQRYWYRFVMRSEGRLPSLVKIADEVGYVTDGFLPTGLLGCARLYAIYDALLPVIETGLKRAGREQDIR